MINWKKYSPLGAMALIIVEFDYNGRSTADPSPESLTLGPWIWHQTTSEPYNLT